MPGRATLASQSSPATPGCRNLRGPGSLLPVLQIWLLCLAWLPLQAGARLHHALDVIIQPGNNSLEVRDTITLTEGHGDTLAFALHPDLKPQLLDSDATLTAVPRDLSDGEDIVAKRYRVKLATGQDRFTLRYRGRVLHSLQQQGEEYARSFRQTRGMISTDGVFLSGASFWYPHVDDAGLMTFDIKLQLPTGWKGMSQGDRVKHVTTAHAVTEDWHCTSPQQEIYLIAGTFTEYSKTADGVQALALLRQPDPALAQKYLDTTHQYIALYRDLIGPYPYTKFAMVENFWETGYGMPSFTLLGPKVIRFPFILHSSYPHEILHNWWGNSVYVDYASGNWAEGLTSYLADHLIKEQRGQAIDYRRTVLQKYTDYVSDSEDFPLTAFRGRHSARTEAVGYGKTLMLFHMLRRQLGDDVFVDGLQSFYRQYRFSIADFPALQRTYDSVAEQSLDGFFTQWVQRSGAPELHVRDARAAEQKNGFRLSALIEQTQSEAPYTLQVPVAVQLDGVAQAYQTEVHVDSRLHRLQLDVPGRPVKLDIDPEFDLFRRLHRSEIPPAVSQAMGAERVLLVLPSLANAEMKNAYQALADSWRTNNPEQVEIILDRQLQQLPDDRAVWLFGWNNRHRAAVTESLKRYDFEDRGSSVRIAQTVLTPARHSLAVLGRHPRQPEQALGWLAADIAAALPGLGRKLPHYGRYSYLAFTGSAPDNILKGQWPVLDSPLSIRVAQADGATVKAGVAQLKPRTALASQEQRFSASRMLADVTLLANENMAGRGLGTPELERAADHLATLFEDAGLQAGGDHDAWFQVWREDVESLDRTVTLKNVVGILPGSDPGHAGESLVIGAHYDHLGRGEHYGSAADRGSIHPGADDNASGLAAMLELARALKDKPLPRTLVFVAFTGEESGRLGSRYYVQNGGNYPADSVIAMLNLDTVGRLGDQPLLLFGTGSADEWAHIFRGAAYVTGVPVNTVADDFGSSDQTSFIDAGIPAVQFFSGNHADVHRPGDTPDKLDSDGLVKVVRVLYEAVQYLGERKEPLHATLPASPKKTATASPPPRRVSFGTVPDFTYSGTGVRLDDVRADTPAAGAGLRKGDIIRNINGTPVNDMREYAAALRQLDPGDEIRVIFQRDGTEQQLTTRVTER